MRPGWTGAAVAWLMLATCLGMAKATLLALAGLDLPLLVDWAWSLANGYFAWTASGMTDEIPPSTTVLRKRWRQEQP